MLDKLCQFDKLLDFRNLSLTIARVFICLGRDIFDELDDAVALLYELRGCGNKRPVPTEESMA